MSGTQPDQKVNMIFNSTDDFRDAAKTFNCATEVFMEVGAPSGFYERTTLLRGEHDVIVEREEG